jgi:hypothetical protein
MAVKHAHTAVSADDPDADIQPSDWNADHVGTNSHTHQSATEGSDLRASAAQITTGTSEAVFATPKALKDAGVQASTGISGWNTVTDTWLYNSPTTIIVPSGAASIYQVGDGWMLDANGVTLKGYISVVANTQLTVIGDALTNYTFSNKKFSHLGNPLGFTQLLNWFNTLIGAAGDLFYRTSATAVGLLAKGTTLQQLRMNAAATAPEWFTPAAGSLATKRQGGSATNWNDSSGTTNYDVAATIIKSGAMRVSIPTTTNYADITITFPTAFSQIPLFFTGTPTVVSGAFGTISRIAITSISASQAVVHIITAANPSSNLELTLPWFAIGE